MILISFNGVDSSEATLDNNEYHDVKFVGGIVEPGDHVLWVREDWADLHPGNECTSAVAAPLSTDATPPDHGGVVRDVGGEPWAEAHLQGQVDAIDPLNTANTSPTGTVRAF